MNLKAAGSYDRVVSLDETLKLVPYLRARFGISRVAETTYLDRASVPTFAAIVPRSPDLLSVYSGKGATRAAALLSAVMEAVERQAAAAPELASHWRSGASVIDELRLDPSTVRAAAREAAVECFEGRDLLTGQRISVPRAMVQCPWHGARFLEGGISTNGLASGNTMLEASYHALCELVERHVWSMHHTKCVLVPRFYGGPGATDAPVAPQIIFPTGNLAVDALAARITAAGLRVRVFWLGENELANVVLASVTDFSNQPAMVHTGMGCSLSPAHAVTRALTESIQSRVVDIQGAREDILRAGETHAVYTRHARRERQLPTGCWHHDLAAEPLDFAQLADRSNSDLGLDLECIVQSLEALSVPRVAIVDLTPRDAPVSVVRAVVPTLETTAIDGRIGARAAALFNPFAAC